MFSLVSATNIGTFAQNEQMQITNYCSTADCTQVNLTSLTYPNGTTIYINSLMSRNGQNFYYDYTPTDLGTYTFNSCGDPSGVSVCDSDSFTVTSTGQGGSMFWIILTTSLAVIFFFASLFVPEEFFVYISGVFWLLGGIYLMIYGLDVLNNNITRNISYVYIGIGFLFTIGAYIYNWISEDSGDEEEY